VGDGRQRTSVSFFTRCHEGLARLWASDGAELLEFAIILPFLAVMAVAVSDFGSAWALKDKLSNAARDGARVAVSAPNDMDNPQCQNGKTPCSVQVAASDVVQYLSHAGVDTCGMNPSSTVPEQGSGASLYTWTYTASGSGCAGAWTLEIERAFVIVSSGSSIFCTRVTLTYPFTWNLAHVVKLIAPGSKYANSITLESAAVMPNLN
jgi:Flp pilus assembly protein TadG